MGDKEPIQISVLIPVRMSIYKYSNFTQIDEFEHAFHAIIRTFRSHVTENNVYVGK